ncbi:zinc ribbon domain-containing protein [Microbacterium sp. NPDC055988]|uniref:zinc ribbon domain-containing protein n=1 Tax=Microbacterium sp. NPDC055988 TaxID=3345671 RepID=UPI0035D829AE
MQLDAVGRRSLVRTHAPALARLRIRGSTHQHHGETKRGIHAPLIAPEEWDAYLEARGRRRVYRRSERSLYAFSGMVWCACRSKMHGGADGADPAAAYRCKDAKEKGKHSGSYVQESTIDRAVRGWLKEREDRIRQETAEAMVQRPLRIASDPTEGIKRRLTQLTSKQISLIEGRLELESRRRRTRRFAIAMTQSRSHGAGAPYDGSAAGCSAPGAPDSS